MVVSRLERATFNVSNPGAVTRSESPSLGFSNALWPRFSQMALLNCLPFAVNCTVLTALPTRIFAK